MADYRPIPVERREEYHQFLDYAFRPEAGPQTYESPDDIPTQVGEPRGLFADDDLLCVCKHIWLTARVRGDDHDLAGLSAVASSPEHRRGGFVRELIRESLFEYRENEVYFAALWPFDYDFYQRLGWATTNRYTFYDTTPEALALDTDDDGEFRRLSADDWERLEPALAAYSDDYSLAVSRTEEWWRERVFDDWRNTPYVYGWFDESGENEDARGYLVYTVDEKDDGKRLTVRELAYADHEAYRHLLRFVQYHDSQVDSVRLYEPENADLLDVVADPREVECEVKTGPMFRLVDVPKALEHLSYPEDAAEQVTVSVNDPLAEWNDGTFALDTTEEFVRCARVDDDPDVTTDVNTLSQVVSGYHSVADAERFGDLTTETDDAADRLASLFPERDVFLREGF